MIKESEVLKIIKSNPEISFISLAKKLKISPLNNNQLTDVLISLIKNYLIVNNRKNSTYTALEKIKSITGKIHFASEGKFGFIDIELPDGEKDSYFVPGANFASSMDGDLVKADIYTPVDPANNRSFGVVKEVVERNTDTLVGVLNSSANFIDFKPIDKLYKHVRFKIRNCIKEARILDVVVAKIVNYDKKNKEIDIIKKITNINDPMAYVKSLEVARNVPEDFSAEIYEYMKTSIPDNIENEDLSQREDFRNELIVTIDGSYTKDFDDAIHVKKIDENTYELGVHIADVAYYVKEGSPLDNEALKRGTSIYLLNDVVPMLPFKLSNGICSLNPNEEKLTLSCITIINRNGESIKTRIVPSVIKSKFRLTYDGVNEFYNSNKKFESKELNEMLTNAYELSQIIREYKNKQGYIDFEVQEPYVELDKTGKVIDIKVEQSGKSERMIEDFMVRANEEVAKFITQAKLPMMYRVHEIPSNEKIDYFLDVLQALNIQVNLDRRNITPLTFQKAVAQINEQRDDDFLKMLYLKTMQKAVYSPDNIGHFGLASECYCHFTSPIRRYPDIVVHRILWEFVFKNNKQKIQDFNNSLEKIAIMNSAAEQNAVQIERDVNDLKFAEYYKNKIHSELEGKIFSITKFGMFIQFENKTDAMVHLSNIGDGDFEPNIQMTELYSKSNSKNRYYLGQTVRVIITEADESSGKVDCVLVSDYKNYLKKQAKKYESKILKNKQKRL
ncbi:ribonuclease R [Mycoplasmopsis primatum]|uniref:ribonuclease R n=1 Tax=Mycoplasmopsis primatum TaxID=55604 RepID=UPI000496A676|nr:ribonuclease R [Mycoplasmopsis primatum]